MKKKYTILSLAFHWVSMPLLLADLNVLVIGQQRSSAEYIRAADKGKAFDPTQVVRHFTEILKGAKHGEVNVTLESSFGLEGKNAPYTNLFTWFHYPFPADVETKTRWPNLRGEVDKKWDFVVLLGDTYSIEHLPGFYALGVSEIGKEVAKGSAKTVLLMPWPSAESTSSIKHYKEVVYRVGRSGGYAVAPAGLAWAAARENASDLHPTANGAYLAAATLYSRLIGESASSSSYEYNDALADLAHQTVEKNKGAIQYKGRFASPHPHSMQFNTVRKVHHSITGTSTERGHLTVIKKVMDACGVEHDNYFNHRYETNDPSSEKSGWPTKVGGPIETKAPISFNIGKFGFYPHDEFKVNPDYWKRAYTFQYQGLLKSNDHAASMVSVHDMRAGKKALEHAPHLGATIPRASWTMFNRVHPGQKLNGGGNHLSPIAILPNAAFIYTSDSGRCPLTPEVSQPSAEWNAMRTGYEAGWIMGNLQVRAPGFRVRPSAADKLEVHNHHTGENETMSVNFIFEPKAHVKVQLTSSHPELVKISPSELTFTPENHDTAQQFTFSVVKTAPTTEEEITITVSTKSADEVYNELQDSWEYTARSRDSVSIPLPLADNYRMKEGGVLSLTKQEGVLRNDEVHADAPATKLKVTENVTHGSLTLEDDGAFTYTPKAEFHGRDSFSYTVSNKNGTSEEATVQIDVSDLDPSLITWYEFEDVGNGVVKDSTAYGRDGTIIDKVTQVDGDEKRGAAVALNDGAISIPIDQEFYDLIGERVSIAFWAHIDPIKKGVSRNTFLNGYQTYGDKTYESLRISFESNVAKESSVIHWQNGIQKADRGEVNRYKISNAQKHSRPKFRLTPEQLQGKWTHWTFTRNRDKEGNFTVYKNGALAFRGGLAGLNAYGLIDEMDTLMMGKGYKGKVDDFRIYNRELSKPEILEVMKQSQGQTPGVR